jgi:hypothetical protein
LHLLPDIRVPFAILLLVVVGLLFAVGRERASDRRMASAPRRIARVLSLLGLGILVAALSMGIGALRAGLPGVLAVFNHREVVGLGLYLSLLLVLAGSVFYLVALRRGQSGPGSSGSD